MKKWEYTTVSIRSDTPTAQVTALLTSFGERGWELVAVCAKWPNQFAEAHIAYFKREVQPTVS